MCFDYKITVFTPTYNRAYIIDTLYRSLQRQTFSDFEWLVVDDGSTDGTEELFAQWSKEDNPFQIHYFKQENGGKCRAINRALGLARGELFFTVDSDDYLTDDALEKVIRWEAVLPKDQKYCAIAGNLGTTPDSTPNKLFAGEYFDGSAFDRYEAIDGERALIFYTEIHRQYLYPEYPGEKFMTEAVAWNRMANDGYKIRFYNDIIWVYEYKEDGLTNAGWRLFLDNPRGTGTFFKEKAKFLKYPFRNVLGMWYGYVCDAMERCTDAQIAEYIGMPQWLVPLMKGFHKWMHLIRKKR